MTNNTLDVLALAKECGGVSYSPPPLRAVRGVSLTFDQLEVLAARLSAGRDGESPEQTNARAQEMAKLGWQIFECDVCGGEYARGFPATPQPAPVERKSEWLPIEIAEIIENLHTQDNRITDNPLFAVQQRREICGVEDGYEDAHVWMNDDCDTINDAEEVADLEAAHLLGEDTPGARRMGVARRWEFVTGCMTEQGCKDYIAVNGHNLKEPRIYAYGSYRNAEFIALRKWLMSLRGIPAPGDGEQCQKGLA